MSQMSICSKFFVKVSGIEEIIITSFAEAKARSLRVTSKPWCSRCSLRDDTASPDVHEMLMWVKLWTNTRISVDRKITTENLNSSVPKMHSIRTMTSEFMSVEQSVLITLLITFNLHEVNPPSMQALWSTSTNPQYATSELEKRLQEQSQNKSWFQGIDTMRPSWSPQGNL